VTRAAIFTFAVAALAVSVRDAAAVSTRVWNVATYKEFDEGTADGTRVTSLGEVTPGVATKKVALDTEAAWTAVMAPDGTVYTGGVTDGAVMAVTPGGKKKLLDLSKDTPWIGALALDGTTLYVGTLSTGTIYAVDTRAGTSRKVVTLEGALHVWSLVVDGKTLWAGTGSDGKLYAVDLGSGRAKVAWDSGEKHLLAVARAADGALWIGTGDNAILFRFDPKTGKARAIADFAGSEVRAVAEVRGRIVAATNEFEQKTGGAPALPTPKGPKGTPVKPPEAGSVPGADKPAPEEATRPEARKGKGALFAVDADGRIEQLHALADGYFTSLAVTDAGEVMVGSGALGRVYQVRLDRTVMTAFDAPERQVNAVMAARGQIAFATGDAGAVYFVTGPAEEARYTSKTFDAAFPSRWGNLRFRGAGVTLETRSGNTAKPGKGWSGWERVDGAAKTAGDAQVGRIASPPGRYLEFRAVFDKAPGGILREVNVYYLPQNQRPHLVDVTIGEEARKGPVTLAPGTTKPRSPILKLKWKVENPDEDELVYTLDYKPEGDGEWRELFTGVEPLTATSFDWNTEALPDGYYRLRVTASDRRANPRDLALDDSRVSPPFLVDNLKPQIQALEVKYPTVTGRAVDSFSRVDEIAYQVDSGEWVAVFPTDGIFDSTSESFAVKLPELKPGPHTLAVRVADEADNIGAAAVTFRVGPK